jgi:intracellular septation protein A
MNTKYKNLYSTTVLMVAMSVIVLTISYIINKDPLNPSQAQLFSTIAKVFGGITVLLIAASTYCKLKK